MAQYKLLSVLGVKPRPSDPAVSFARGGFGGLTVNGEPGFFDSGELTRSDAAVHALHQCSFVLNVTLSPGSNFCLNHTITQTIMTLCISCTSTVNS